MQNTKETTKTRNEKYFEGFADRIEKDELGMYEASVLLLAGSAIALIGRGLIDWIIWLLG